MNTYIYNVYIVGGHYLGSISVKGNEDALEKAYAQFGAESQGEQLEVMLLRICKPLEKAFSNS